ncbi:MAG: PQQ-binding-like beta-propeller repeat protein [Pseudomonadales bacterium]
MPVRLFSILIFTLSAMVASIVSAGEIEFPRLAKTPYPAQHGNPRNSDAVPFSSPTELKLKWKALEDSSIVQGCTTDRGQLYCVLGWDKKDRCNLIALDERDGSTLWEDRVNGECILDEFASLTNPTIDTEGNLYINDSEKIVSFTSDGQVRWINNTPATLPSRKGLPNAPFGMVLLANGNLATATMGDGWVLFLDGKTGELIKEPFDLPAEKRNPQAVNRVLIPDTRPDGFMENLMSQSASQMLWDFAFGESDYETDNNVAIAEKHQLMIIASGAPYPNTDNVGALWAVDFSGDKPKVAFYVELPVEGGIATSPTLSKDNSIALIGDNEQNLVVVDIESCLAEADGSACSHYSMHPLGHDLTSSVILTDENRLIIPAGHTGYAAYDLKKDTNGAIQINPLWQTRLAWLPIGISVHLAFDNVVWIPFYHMGRQQTFIVALDIESGEEVARYESGDAANVTMASDGKTIIAQNLSFIESAFKGRVGLDVKGGVWAWEPVTEN